MSEHASLHILIVDGSPQPSSPELVAGLAQECDLVVAVDRGADVCRVAGVVPDSLVGDFDTVSDEARSWIGEHGVAEVGFPTEKDYTDLSLALEVAGKLADERDATWIPVITCCTGGRLDHQLGVMGVLRAAAALQPMVMENGFEAFVLSPEGRATWNLGEVGRGKDFSLVPLVDSVVSEENMYWELDHEPIGALIDRGISNRVTTGFASVTCHEGCVFAMLMWG